MSRERVTLELLERRIAALDAALANLLSSMADTLEQIASVRDQETEALRSLIDDEATGETEGSVSATEGFLRRSDGRGGPVAVSQKLGRPRESRRGSKRDSMEAIGQTQFLNPGITTRAGSVLAARARHADAPKR